jgi:redox-sensitive bicupin YhaK (pirin superfamily)
MLTLRRSTDRGVADYGWLNSYYTFSFADYFDPQQMGFGALRVLNEDQILGGKGFPTHSHRDMEIITYVLAGALAHKDSMGNGSVIQPGDVQRMSAGTGIAHSEYNHSITQTAHLLQIWILPDQRGLDPSYEQKHFDPSEKQNRWCLVGSQDGRENSVLIHQDVNLYTANLNQGFILSYQLEADRQAWLQVARGRLRLNEQEVATGDGVAIVNHLAHPSAVTLESLIDEAEVLLFDLAA